MSQDKPVHEVRLGKVKAAIWRNETDIDCGMNSSRSMEADGVHPMVFHDHFFFRLLLSFILTRQQGPRFSQPLLVR